ncbi:hypothetical protein HK098_007719 [Nowakowskiella sp. JEL0407]|nr:hypothetical protein HK098_007719 [Nowakowskiella sp. JEL0407]
MGEEKTEKVESKESHHENPLNRYLAYGARLPRLLARIPRVAAYTSEVGEAFRPVAHPVLVSAAYGISWLYIGVDVFLAANKEIETEKEKATSLGVKYEMNTMELTRTCVERTVFQSIASMLLPAFAVHRTVHTADHYLKNMVKAAEIASASGKKAWMPSKSLLRWGPTGLGIAVIPLLPVLFDEPTEWVVEKAFENIWPGKHKHH